MCWTQNLRRSLIGDRKYARRIRSLELEGLVVGRYVWHTQCQKSSLGGGRVL